MLHGIWGHRRLGLILLLWSMQILVLTSHRWISEWLAIVFILLSIIMAIITVVLAGRSPELGLTGRFDLLIVMFFLPGFSLSVYISSPETSVVIALMWLVLLIVSVGLSERYPEWWNNMRLDLCLKKER